MGTKASLRLAAEDPQDLEILSAALQDAVFKIADAAFDPKGRRFALRVNRFRWEAGARTAERVQSLLLVESALSVRSLRVKLGEPEAIASLLALRFEPDAEPPGGEVRLLLSGGGEIRARVDAIDMSLADVSAPWRAARRPSHGEA